MSLNNFLMNNLNLYYCLQNLFLVLNIVLCFQVYGLYVLDSLKTRIIGMTPLSEIVGGCLKRNIILSMMCYSKVHTIIYIDVYILILNVY